MYKQNITYKIVYSKCHEVFGSIKLNIGYLLIKMLLTGYNLVDFISSNIKYIHYMNFL